MSDPERSARNETMHLTLSLLATCLLIAACKESEKHVERNLVQPEFFVGRSSDPEWPYRYTLVRTQGQWSGEIEIDWGEGSIFFDKLDVISSNDQGIRFEAMLGQPGKAFPTEWELSLSKSGNDFDGLLIAKSGLDEFEPIHLKLVATKSAILPSNELERKLLSMDDAGYRTESALAHEVAIAKQEWQRESKIAERISELRMDDRMRRGIRKEWTGPVWVRDRVTAEDSKYFERICCVYLGGTSVTDSDVQAISGLTELRELFLHQTEITDAALERFGSLRGLRILHLRNTGVSDEGLENLRDLTNLENLYLFETRISEAGGKKLRSLLPNTDIQW
jgi:hypothetical protein